MTTERIATDRSTSASRRARAVADRLGLAWALGGVATAVALLVQLLPFLADGVAYRWGGRPVAAVIAEILAVLLLIPLTGAAVALARTRPGAALALAWASALAWSIADVPLMTSQVALGVVAFACARWGTPGERLAALASLPAIPLLIGGGFGVPGAYVVDGLVGRLLGGLGGVGPLGVGGPGVWAIASLLSLALLTSVAALPFAAGAVARRVDSRASAPTATTVDA